MVVTIYDVLDISIHGEAAHFFDVVPFKTNAGNVF